MSAFKFVVWFFNKLTNIKLLNREAPRIFLSPLPGTKAFYFINFFQAKIITQACAEKWRNMTDGEKEPFLELSRRDRERWQKDKALEKKPRDPNRPKRPPSAYFLFLAEFRKKYLGKTDPAKVILNLTQ